MTSTKRVHPEDHACKTEISVPNTVQPLFEQLLLQDIRESIHASAAQDHNVTKSHSAAAHTNGRDYRRVGHDKVAVSAPSFSSVRLKVVPAMHGIKTQVPQLHHRRCKSSANAASRATYSSAEDHQNRSLGLPQSAQHYGSHL